MADHPLTVTVDWQEDNAGRTIIGNDSFRFDTHTQSDTLGPQPPNEMDGPEPTNGEPGASPKAPEPALGGPG